MEKEAVSQKRGNVWVHDTHFTHRGKEKEREFPSMSFASLTSSLVLSPTPSVFPAGMLSLSKQEIVYLLYLLRKKIIAIILHRMMKISMLVLVVLKELHLFHLPCTVCVWESVFIVYERMSEVHHTSSNAKSLPVFPSLCWIPWRHVQICVCHSFQASNLSQKPTKVFKEALLLKKPHQTTFFFWKRNATCCRTSRRK